MVVKPKKIAALMATIKRCLETGNYIDSRHVLVRQSERMITRLELFYVLEHGFHEPKKDNFKPEYNEWNYSVRGKTFEERSLRVIVSFDKKTQLLIITAIDLDK